jgi:hypothetical protein
MFGSALQVTPRVHPTSVVPIQTIVQRTLALPVSAIVMAGGRVAHAAQKRLDGGVAKIQMR